MIIVHNTLTFERFIVCALLNILMPKGTNYMPAEVLNQLNILQQKFLPIDLDSENQV